MSRKGRAIRTAIDANLCLRLSDLGRMAAMRLKSEFTRPDPKYHRAKNMGFFVKRMSPIVRSWRVDGDWLLLPRGAVGQVVEILGKLGLRMAEPFDRTVSLESCGFKLQHKLRLEQQHAARALVRAQSGTIRGPCGSGKTVMLLGAIAMADQPAIVVVPTKALAEQWHQAVLYWLGIMPGHLAGKREDIRRVTIASQQTVWRRKGRWWVERFGVVVGDECHHWAASTFQIITNMFPAKYRFGASADERRKDGLEFLIYETFGDVAYAITRDEMVEAGRLAPVKMEVLETEFVSEDYMLAVEGGYPVDWGSLLTETTQDAHRNKLILDAICAILDRDPSSRILLLTERVTAAREWVARMKMLGYPSGLMIGGAENRVELQQSISGLRDGAVRFGAGTRVADEGLDIPALTHVVITCPMHQHPKRLEQMIGRAARKYKNKKHGTCLYVWDRRMFPRSKFRESEARRAARERAFLNKLAVACDGWRMWRQ